MKVTIWREIGSEFESPVEITDNGNFEINHVELSGSVAMVNQSTYREVRKVEVDP